MRNIRILLTPAFLLALAVLVLNDHVLKQACPCWLTGKLSDFAGLFVFVIFIYALIPHDRCSRRVIAWLHVLTGLAFVAWKVAPVELVLDEINNWTGLPMPSRVKDATDLIALVILPIGYTVIVGFDPEGRRPAMAAVRGRVIASLVLLATGWSVLATSTLEGPSELRGCWGMRGNVDHDSLDIVDSDDIVYLENYLYHGGPRPESLLEADVDCSGDKNPVTEDDLQYLIDYIYNSGPPPCDCP